nr:UDP-N-acetylmuramoyl-tripeptide--D-alanyl-D-alanine ligase [uncultured Alistipes sp.]
MELYDLYCKFPRISTDSRQVVAGGIFFALHGETFDGNRYAAAAVGAGAAAAVIDDPAVTDGMSAAEKANYFVVPDTLKALQELAARHRRQLGIPILAITGSNGKTTTKELISRTLKRKYRVAVTQGNFNNHIGVPLTLLAMDRSAEFGVVEMGASHCGEIALLCSIAQPDFGLITNIGKAHLEGFGGIEGVMRGKGELLDYLQAHGGTAFYSCESEYLAQMIGKRKGLQAVPYSTAGMTAAEKGNYLTVRKGATEIRTHLVGDYNIGNVAAAIAVGGHFGVPEQQIVAAIESYEPDNNRSQRKAGARNTLIMDAYNANPSSMRAALANFAKEPSEQPKAVVLGDMGELGKYAEAEHAGIVELLQQLGIGEVYLVGKLFSEAGRGIYPAFADAAALNEYLQEHPIHGRLILVKGSRTMKLESVAERL